MLNLTIAGLSLASSFGCSPLLATSRHTSTTVAFSRFSSVLHPLLYSNTPQIISLLSSTFVRLHGAVVHCTDMPSEPDTKVISGCVTAASRAFSGWVISAQSGLSFLESSLTIVNCSFSAFSGPYALSISRSAVQMNACVVSDVPSFLMVKQPVNNSQITNVTFSGSTLSILWALNGKFSVYNSTFSNLSPVAKATLISLTECTEFRLYGCIFDLDRAGTWEKLPILYAISTTNIAVRGCQFMTQNTTRINLSRSYMIVRESCFFTELDDMLDLSDGAKVASENRANEFDRPSCPYIPTTEPVSAQDKAYAIATIVIFFSFFAVLFIVLIVYVFCKAGNEKVQQYAGLHAISEEGSEDAEIMSE